MPTTARNRNAVMFKLLLTKESAYISSVEAALKAIAAPRRRQILTLVRDGELSAGEIASHFDITRPAVSQHLNVLKEAGLVSERRNGTRRLYRETAGRVMSKWDAISPALSSPSRTSVRI